MQRLNRDMLERYDIPPRAPAGVRAGLFGLNDPLPGVATRLLSQAMPDLGLACVPSDAPHTGDGADPAALLGEQDGLYTLLIRGYRGETPVTEERVVQSILRVMDGKGALDALAAEPALCLGLVDMESGDPEADLRNVARLLTARHRAGRDGLALMCLGEDADCGAKTRDAVAALAAAFHPEAGFADWLATTCAFHSALAEGFAFRADAKSAARQCAAMNYADGMLMLAEPFARLTVQAPADFRARWPLDAGGDIRFTDDLSPVLAQKRRYFDASLFAMAAPGWLLGCDTLSDCMKHPRLREFVGKTCDEELLPPGPEARQAAAPAVIEAFGRFENPLTPNALLPSVRPLLGRFRRAVLPLIRAWADERFEPPRRLTFALAAAIMLCAGARPNAQGRYEVLRGNQVHILDDDPAALSLFATLAHDMPPEALAYAVLADRELWHGEDLREIDGLEARVALDIANLQRQPDYLP